jgi:hypothetical protein
MDLVLKIRMDQKDVDILLSSPPPFPKLPHPLRDYSTPRFLVTRVNLSKILTGHSVMVRSVIP